MHSKRLSGNYGIILAATGVGILNLSHHPYIAVADFVTAAGLIVSPLLATRQKISRHTLTLPRDRIIKRQFENKIHKKLTPY